MSSPSAVREINNSSSDGSEEGDNTHVSHGKPDSSQGLSHSTDLSGSDVESYKVSGVQTTLRPSPSSFHIQSLHLINEFKAKAMSCVCSICKLFCKTEQELTDHMIRRHNVQVRDLVTVSVSGSLSLQLLGSINYYAVLLDKESHLAWHTKICEVSCFI